MGFNSLNLSLAIQELIKGKELVAQLGALLEGVNQELIDEISASFSKALIALESGVKKENCLGTKRKIQYQGRRGDKKRTEETDTLNDGHSWRKYGQKAIQNSKFPKAYYRCTHKNDQKCDATRHVQISEKDPSRLLVTYVGEHTCKPLNSLENRPYLINFTTSPAQSMGKESCNDVVSPSSTTTSDYFSSIEMEVLEESESVRLLTELLGEGSSENEDVVGVDFSIDELFNFEDFY